MSFLAPSMLVGALAAGIPIILHFFYRSRYRTVPWAAMRFLLTAIEQTSRRLKFQELLLLAVRVLLLLLLALALARPTWNLAGLGTRGDAVDAVLILDTSMSMGARAGVVPPGGGNDPYLAALRSFALPDGSVTRFDRARASALAILANLPAHSTVQIVSCSDRAELLGPQAPSHLDRGKQILEGLKLTHLGTDFLPAVQLAGDLVQRGPSPNKEVYLISDQQTSGWEKQEPALVAALQELQGRAAVHIVRCAGPNPVNLTITGITPQSTLRPGERADFAVLVKNTGSELARNLTVSLEVDGKTAERDTRPVDEIKPGETRAVVLSGLLDKPGRSVVTASVRPDDLEADNRFDQIIQVQERTGILLVDGAPDYRDPKRSAAYFLQHAINPTDDPSQAIPLTILPPERVTPKDLAGKDLCVLVNVRLSPARQPGEEVKEEGGVLLPEVVRALPGFVQDGHGLLIFAGDRVEATAYNETLFEQHRLLPLPLGNVETAPNDKPWTLDRASATTEPFNRFRQEVGYASIDKVEVRRAFSLNEKVLVEKKADRPDGTEEKRSSLEEVRVLLRYSNGLPAIASRKQAGQGEVLLFTTSVSDPRWSDWFIAPAFVPFVQVALNHLLEDRPLMFNRVAGEPLTWQPPRVDAERSFDLVQPDGSRQRLGYPVADSGRALLTFTDTSRAGVYRIQPTDPGSEGTGAAGVPFALTPDLRESESLESLSDSAIDQKLGFKPAHLTAGDDGAVFSGAERLKREWTLWLLAGVLGFIVIEAVLAWLCGRSW